jgi:PAS domain S-box-containing protein
MPSTSKVNILLVDDHPENLVALEAILDGLGQNLVKANSGEETLRRLLLQDFAVILLDVQMPGMDGFETASLIRQRERSRNTPIIFLTAFSNNDNFVFKGYALGAVDYLLKPLDPVILSSKVSVFVDLFKKTTEVQRQAAELAAINAELRQSEERFRSLSASAPLGIFLIDTAGQCTYTNPNCQTICGLKSDESLQASWARCIHAEDRDRILGNLSANTRFGQSYADEFRIYTPDGGMRWIDVQISPMLSDQRQLLGHVGTVEDVTERKLAESVREQMIREQTARAEAEAANQMKDEFLAIVSHELRTPLNSILGWSQQLLTRKFDSSNTTRALETIHRNAQSQAQLIEDILDVSRIVQGKLKLTMQRVNLVELIKTILETVRPQADSKAIQLETFVDEGPYIVSGDIERLRQIIWNLVCNAIKFTPESGRVEVRLSIVANGESEIASRQEILPTTYFKLSSPHIQLQVIDTGIGIPANFIPYLFDRFRQADSSSTRSYGGLGLGLTIARHLVELHNGSIYAHSEGEGKGATFTVNLPLFQGASSEEPRATTNKENFAHEPTLNGMQILLVEDNKDSRDFIKIVLEDFGALVTDVASAKEAINCLEKSSFDVLVSDIGMPEINGYELMRYVRCLEEQQGGKIPAIALTAYARQEDRMEALDAGFQMHISKPIESAELIISVAQLAGLVKVTEIGMMTN